MVVPSNGTESVMHTELRRLEAIERKAWNAKARGSDEDTCTIYRREGKLELAWRAAADACREYRERHGLLGLTWKQIAAKESC